MVRVRLSNLDMTLLEARLLREVVTIAYESRMSNVHLRARHLWSFCRIYSQLSSRTRSSFSLKTSDLGLMLIDHLVVVFNILTILAALKM